jgi:hypothetical protein
VNSIERIHGPPARLEARRIEEERVGIGPS